MLRKLMFFVCMFTSLQCFSQSTIEATIKRLSEVANNNFDLENRYIYSFSDSTMTQYPIFKNCKNLGTLKVQSSQHPDCELLYDVYEYDNKDSVLRKIRKQFTLSNCFQPSPFEPSFFYKKYLFFIGGNPCTWDKLDDRCKYMSIKIHNQAELNSKYD